MLHSGPEKPHLPCSLRCCCLSAVSAYQVQLADCADAAVDAATRADARESTTRDLVIGDFLLVLWPRGGWATHALEVTPLWIV